ncbi:MAG: peptide chain release factor N(5)-glutamine methyltransferase [Bacteroidia bacterium]|jgi:release factor glutamine methyltransferase|nr:peptide chain release factor N(5)-glutamine methyltransferase [Bacteroidia bacterium]GIV23595.1 MAG: release factor glutamine methyltransferase [Bacteroidia bacterium]
MDSQPVVSRETPSLAALRIQSLRRLEAIYPPTEAQAIVRRLFAYFLPEWEQVWLATRGESPFPPDKVTRWEEALQRLLNQEPLAYILGETSFLGLPLTIQPGVFIPRPETEEWASWLIRTLSPHPPKTILDIGTGSGCLAIALAKHFPKSQIYAIDKNPLALQVAQKNAEKNKISLTLAQISFGQRPFPPDWPSTWDLIVSNPPYIPWEAFSETEARVRCYEPPEALFCKGLGLIPNLIQFAKNHLSKDGLLVVEIFPENAEKIALLAKREGLTGTIYTDSFRRPRWIGISEV